MSFIFYIPSPKLRKEAVTKMQGGYFCVYCKSTENLVMDHLVALKGGGSDDIRNIVLACGLCNNRKLHYDVKKLREFGHHHIADGVEEILAQRKDYDEATVRKLLENPLPPDVDNYQQRYQFVQSTSMGTFIHKNLVELGLSRHALRKILNLYGKTPDRWCTGQSIPSPTNLKRLAKLFEVSHDKLIDLAIESEKERGAKLKHYRLPLRPEHIKPLKQIWKMGFTLEKFTKFIGLPSGALRHFFYKTTSTSPSKYLERCQALCEILCSDEPFDRDVVQLKLDAIGLSKTIHVLDFSTLKEATTPFGEYLQEILKKKNIHPKKVRRILKLNSGRLRGWCQGESLPSPLSLKRLVQLLDSEGSEIHKKLLELAISSEPSGGGNRYELPADPEWIEPMKQIWLQGLTLNSYSRAIGKDNNFLRTYLFRDIVPRKTNKKQLETIRENLMR